MGLSALLVLATIASASPTAPAVELPPALTVPACVACRTTHADDEPTLARVRSGDIVVTEEDAAEVTSTTTRRVVEVAAVIDHAPARIWSILTDFPGRSTWQPGAKNVAVVRTEANRVWVDEWARFLVVDVHYRLALTLEPEAGEIHFAMDEDSPHDIGGARGHWRLRPMDGGRRTLVAYRAWIDVGHGMPRLLQTLLLKYSLPRLLANLRAESDRRFPSAE